jgi:hypothetical protein
MLFRLEPDYMKNCFSVIDIGFPNKVESWLKEQVDNQVVVGYKKKAIADSADNDKTLNEACLIAKKEGVTEVDAGHFFQALMSDEESTTIKAIAKAITSEEMQLLKETSCNYNRSYNGTTIISGSIRR